MASPADHAREAAPDPEEQEDLDVKIRGLLRGSSLAATASIARRLRDRLEERLVLR